jgi:riboflavin kinase/FMN adenylyltransferase
MDLIRHIDDISLQDQPCVATIGNFDGVHLGHQSLIRQLVNLARSEGLRSTVITFEPLPMEFFSAETAPARLTDFREKIELLQTLSVDKVVCLRFNEALASLSAQAFIERILIRGLAINKLIVGADFRFGNNREGTIDFLRQTGLQHGFELIPAETYHYNGLRVSSSLVRGHLAIGDFDHVKDLLGRSYSISGRVIHGDKRGKSLGFPTANLACNRVNSPISGVFAVRVHGLGSAVYEGVTNIGTRPVFDGDRMLIETFIFDFDEDIYGKRISVEFLKRLRDERDFHSVEELCEQMGNDVIKAKVFFSKQRQVASN